MRLQFGGSDPVGKSVIVEFKITREHVQCWVGGAVVYLDREVLAAWLTAPCRNLSTDEVTFEPAAWGVVFSFDGRVRRTVIGPADVAELANAVNLSLPSGDGVGAVHRVHAGVGPAGGGRS